MSLNIQNFDVQRVPLEHKNLIEASAGTGKTFSIAILMLRLLLEKNIRINEILMVTFTTAAVAELQERIRHFVRTAHRYASGEEVDNPMIMAIVDTCIEKNNAEFAQEKLHSALINLDETAVMTIHGFCQVSLNEFAFETNQLFNAELIPDVGTIILEITQKFWREHITCIESGLLKLLINSGLSIPAIIDLTKSHLDGKKFWKYDANKHYELTEETLSEFRENLETAAKNAENQEEHLRNYMNDNFDELLERCQTSTLARKNILPNVSDANSLCALISGKKGSKYVSELFPEILELMAEKEVLEAQKTNVATACLDYVFAFAIQEIGEEVEKKKMILNQMSFDDIITKMHVALNKKHTVAAKQKLQQDLIRGLQRKYKAVFIDEFQDTDKQQYDIFSKAFEQNTILFYIGDPKQSIYAWRKADIATYFKAREQVDNLYTMTTNFRSTPNMVAAMNIFFQPTPDFDTFHYDQVSDVPTERIDYIAVNTPKKSGKSEITENGTDATPISVFYAANKTVIKNEVVSQISALLNNPAYKIKNRNIKPSDIGILVRAKDDGVELKNLLSKVGIPAVTVTEAKVLDAPEAAEMVYVLEAILNNDRSKVNRALTTSFINWSPDEILRMDEDYTIEQFRNFHQKWQRSGVYAALTDFITEFNIQQKLLDPSFQNGERVITNLYHLMEMLYKIENRQHFAPAELLSWLKINRGKGSTDDEMIQRIESDEEAVQITTIHSSKGLEYNIVFAPSLDFKAAPTGSYFDDRMIGIQNKDGEYISLKRRFTTEELEQLYEIQSEQENRRLLYVAITRAIYKCYVFRSSGAKSSTLSHFLDHIDFNTTQGLIDKPELLQTENPRGYRQENQNVQLPLVAKNFQLQHTQWTQTSYSRLAAQPDYIPRDNYEANDDEYAAFVFRELAKGAKTGTFVHEIFENIDFTNSERWQYAIARGLGRFAPDKNKEYADKIHQFLQQVLHTEIDTGEEIFKLSDVPAHELLHEMEFDFPMELFPVKNLEDLLPLGIVVKNPEDYPSRIEGIMTGFVDLFFRHNGKFYILDWKTNYLGSKLEDYSPQKLEEAMNDNNYHLQYLIYTYGMNLYLTHRLGAAYDYDRDFGGVLYLFVRGMRNGQQSGIFFTKPKMEQVELMEGMFRGK